VPGRHNEQFHSSKTGGFSGTVQPAFQVWFQVNTGDQGDTSRMWTSNPTALQV